MKIKEGFVVREVAGQAMVVATGEASKDFHGMIRLNHTGKLVWQGVAEGLDASQIAQSLVSNYDVDPEKALADVNAMIEKMDKAGILCR